MPQRFQSEAEIVYEREEEERQREFAKEAEDRKREHEYKMAQLELTNQPWHKSFERGVIVLVKLPALPVALVCITVLIAKGKKVPDQLLRFLTV